MNNNKDPRQELLRIVEALGLPVTREEALSHINNLADDEVETLLPCFEYVKKYEETISKKAKETNPQKTAIVEGTYERNLASATTDLNISLH